MIHLPTVWRRAQPVLPGESAAPVLPSHGTAAPKLLRFTVETYRGCAAGWQPTVTRKDRAAADRLLILVGRIRNDRIHRISAT